MLHKVYIKYMIHIKSGYKFIELRYLVAHVWWRVLLVQLYRTVDKVEVPTTGKIARRRVYFDMFHAALVHMVQMYLRTASLIFLLLHALHRNKCIQVIIQHGIREHIPSSYNKHNNWVRTYLHLLRCIKIPTLSNTRQTFDKQIKIGPAAPQQWQQNDQTLYTSPAPTSRLLRRERVILKQELVHVNRDYYYLVLAHRVNIVLAHRVNIVTTG